MKYQIIEILRLAEDEDLQISVSDDIIRDEQVIEIRVSNQLLERRVSPETYLAYLLKEEQRKGRK